MGKPNEGFNPTGNQEGEEVQESSSCCNACASSICTGKTLKCVIALVLTLNVLAFGVWSFPFFGKHYGAYGRPASASNLLAQIQGSFRLQEPISAVNANIPKLESAIWEEVGVPSTKVAVISLEPLNAINSTEVIFDILPDPENTYISPYVLFLLRETFINLVSGSYNLSLKSGDFGDVHFFELLKFPGGITVVPKQRVFPLQRISMLFNFTLHSTIAQVVQNLAQLRKQLSIGLHVRPDENVLVQLTNLQGSTVNPPIVVETFIVPVVGMKGLPTTRLRQLAHEINPSRNLGLNHTLFGKVKQIQLSSYLSYPSSPPYLLSPAPSPSQHTFTSHISPLSSHPYTSPTHSMPPSYDQHVGAPSPHTTVLAPVSHHHSKSPHFHHGKPPSYHHIVAPSSRHPLVHCDRHHASDAVKCSHAGHAPISGLNGEAPPPSPDIAGPSRHNHRTAASPPCVMTSVPPAFSPRNGISPKAWYWGSHSPPFALGSPPSSRLPHHPAPKSAPPSSSVMVSSPKSSHLSPKGLFHSPPPKKTMVPHPYLPGKISPTPAFAYVSSSSYARNPIQLIIGSLILVGIVLSVLA